MTATQTREPGTDAERLIVVSADAHIGPRLEADLRPYCPKQYLVEFDEYSARTVRGTDMLASGRTRVVRRAQEERNLKSAGHYDVDARLRDMDRDGVAA